MVARRRRRGRPNSLTRWLHAGGGEVPAECGREAPRRRTRLFGALWSDFKLVTGSPSGIRWERIVLGTPPRLAGSTRGHPSAWRSSGQPLVRPPGPVSSRAPGVLRRPGDGAPAATRGGGRGAARTEHDGKGTTPRRRSNAGLRDPSARLRGLSPRLTATPALGDVDVPARRRGHLRQQQPSGQEAGARVGPEGQIAG